MQHRHKKANHQVIGQGTCRTRSEFLEIAGMADKVRTDPETGKRLIKTFKKYVSGEMYEQFNDAVSPN